MKRFKWFLKNFEEVCGAFLLFSMALLAFINVLTRYFIKYSFASTEELEVASLVFLTMLGSSAAFKKDLHLKLMYLENKASPRYKFFLNVLALLLSLFLFTTIGFLSYFHIIDEIDLNITTEALNIPEWIYVLAIPLGSILINIRIIQRLIKLFKERR
jgi:TRAP-type C4-dicarboxylate transport system permease small subunit